MSADPLPGDTQRDAFAYWCPWKLRDLIIGIALILVWRCLPFLKTNPFVILPAWTQGALLLYGPQLFYLLFPLLVLRRRKGKLRNRLPGVKRIAIETIIAIGSLAILAAVLVGIAAIIKLVSPEATLTPMTWTHRAAQLGHSRLLSVLLVSSITIAPLCEEIFFRGFLHQAFRSRMPIVVAAFTQSLLFSLMHSLDWVLTPASLFVGLILTIVYEWRKTLVTPICLHAGLNLSCAILFLFVIESHNNRPLLGISGYEHADKCEVRFVVPDSAAAEAGIKAGDIITAFDEHRVSSFPQLLELIRKKKAGDNARIRIQRGGAEQAVRVTLQAAARGPN